MASKRLYLKEGDAHLEESALVHIIKPPGGSNDFHVWFQSMGYVAIDNITVEAGNTVPVPRNLDHAVDWAGVGGVRCSSSLS